MIGLYVLDKWSVLRVSHVWVVGSNISDRTLRTGHVVSAVCSVCGWWYLLHTDTSRMY